MPLRTRNLGVIARTAILDLQVGTSVSN